MVRGIGGEEVGLRLLSLASVVAAALVAFHLAVTLGGRRAGPWGFAVAAASPVLADGFMFWAHAPSAALAGLAVLALLRLLDRVSWPWTVVLAVALAAGVSLRSEGLLFAAALLLVFGAVALTGTGDRRWPRLGAATVAGLASIGTFLLERAWTSDIVGERVVTAAEAGAATTLSGRINGAVTSLFDGSLVSNRAGALSVLAVVLVLAAVVATLGPTIRLRPSVLLGAAAAVGIVRILVEPTDPVLGLFAASPVLLLAALSLRPSTPREPGPRTVSPVIVVIAVGVVFAGAVLATQYDDGGGVQWGGRYLAPAVVPLAALVALAVERLRAVDRLAPVGLAALLAVGGVAAFVIPDQVRRDNVDAVERIAAPGNDVILVGNDNTARLDWRHWPERRWIASNGDLNGALAILRNSLVHEATAVLVPVGELRNTGLVILDGPVGEHDTLVPFTLDPGSNVRSTPGAGG